MDLDDQASSPVALPARPRAREDEQQELIAELTQRLATLAASELELRGLVRDAHVQLEERDVEIAALSAGRRPWEGELQALYIDRDQARDQLDAVTAQISAMRSTRAWRAAVLWWRLRDIVHAR